MNSPRPIESLLRSGRRRAAAIAVCIVIVLALGLAIFGNDSKRPNFPPIAQRSGPPLTGTILYGEYANGAVCIFAVDAAGSSPPKQMQCEQGPEGVQWGFTDSGEAIVTAKVDPNSDTGLIRTTVTRTSGELVEQFEGHGDAIKKPTSSPELFTYITELDANNEPAGDGDPKSTWVATDDKGKNRIVEARSSNGYSFVSAERSPDRQSILIFDSSNRLLIADNNGDVHLLLDAPSNKELSRIGAGATNGGANWFQEGRPLANGYPFADLTSARS